MTARAIKARTAISLCPPNYVKKKKLPSSTSNLQIWALLEPAASQDVALERRTRGWRCSDYCWRCRKDSLKSLIGQCIISSVSGKGAGQAAPTGWVFRKFTHQLRPQVPRATSCPRHPLFNEIPAPTISMAPSCVEIWGLPWLIPPSVTLFGVVHCTSLVPGGPATQSLPTH